MRNPIRLSLLAALVCAAVLPAGARAAETIVDRPVAFTVQNVNRSKLPCATDGATYTVRGHLTGPASAIASPKAATLYLHGLGLGEFFWRFEGVPGYDFTDDLARRGRVSVTIDRLGYLTSDKAPGMQSCIGAQADIAHQIIEQLKAGSYAGATHPAFADVGLVGHSAGGLITQVEAYSFGDAKAIGVLAYADQGISNFQLGAAGAAKTVCVNGGVPASSAGPGGYALLGQTLPVGRRAFFASARENVISSTLPLLTKNPCGDLASYMAAPPVDKANLAAVTAPVLLVQGAADKLFPDGSVNAQRGLFSGSPAVTYRSIPRSGHALTLESGHTQLVRDVGDFLTANGL